MSERYLTLFQLYRREDASGVSGTGTVAYGIEFPYPNQCAVLGWVTDTNSVAVYDSIDDVEEIHGHSGKTTIVEMDKIDVGGPE